MFRCLPILPVLLFCVSAVSAQDVPTFHFQTGDSYRFKLEQITKIEDTSIDDETKKPVTAKMQSKLTVTKVWKIEELLKNGSALMSLSIATMRLERTDAKGEVSVYDSEKPDEKNPDNNAEFKKFINQTLAVLVIDSRGQVVEVKESKQGSPKGFQVELPFKMMLPEKAPQLGSTWDRSFEIELPPPAGTGEKYKASQKYIYGAEVNQMRKIRLETAFDNFPAGADGIPLLKHLAEGDVYYHQPSGRYIGCRLTGKKVIENYQGEGTRYSFESSLSEDLLKQ